MSAADEIVVQRIVRSLKKMVDRATADTPDHVGAIVTSTSPLMVVLPGASTPVPAYALPSYPVGSRHVNDRVFTTSIRGELYVHGVAS